MADTPSPPPPGLEDLEALVLEVFSRVWEEFNVADAEYCEATIGSLAATSVAEDNTLATKSETTAALPCDMSHRGSRLSGVATLALGPPGPHVPHVRGEPDIPTLTSPLAVEPYPEHESWTPTTRSIFRGDDSNDMQFLPFADEPAFDKTVYRKFFKTLAWQGGEQMDVDRGLPTVITFVASSKHWVGLQWNQLCLRPHIDYILITGLNWRRSTRPTSFRSLSLVAQGLYTMLSNGNLTFTQDEGSSR
jgi:hypothetical protein